jgi:antitoxin (DNA-binding transcriptional repressor) of toxin-antitoxin stability system
MRKVNTHEAKSTLSQLVETAEAGESVVLVREGKPVVELVRLKKKKRGIKLGGLKGMFPEEFLAAAAEPLSPQDVG